MIDPDDRLQNIEECENKNHSKSKEPAGIIEINFQAHAEDFRKDNTDIASATTAVADATRTSLMKPIHLIQSTVGLYPISKSVMSVTLTPVVVAIERQSFRHGSSKFSMIDKIKTNPVVITIGDGVVKTSEAVGLKII